MTIKKYTYHRPSGMLEISPGKWVKIGEHTTHWECLSLTEETTPQEIAAFFLDKDPYATSDWTSGPKLAGVSSAKFITKGKAVPGDTISYAHDTPGIVYVTRTEVLELEHARYKEQGFIFNEDEVQQEEN